MEHCADVDLPCLFHRLCLLLACLLWAPKLYFYPNLLFSPSLASSTPSSQGDDQDSSLDPDPELLQEIADAPTGMRDKDLRTMKDTLLIETVQLLGVGV